MDTDTLRLFETRGSVCGCLGLWGFETAQPAGKQTPDLHSPYHPCHSTPFQLSSSSAVTSLSQWSSKPPCGPALHPVAPRSLVEAYPITSRHALVTPYPAPSGPPKETCFFWYHGECRLGLQCHRAHETHVTWPIPPPPKYVHWSICHLPLCPLRDGLEEVMKDCVVKEEGAYGASEGSAGVGDDVGVGDGDGDGVDVGVGVGVGVDIDVDVEVEVEVIKLSSGRSSSIASSSSDLSATLSLHRKVPEVTAISHVGTRTRKRTHGLKFKHQESVRTVPEHTCPQRPPKEPFMKELVCFFWYHQGLCKSANHRPCLYLHTFPKTGPMEVSLPDNLCRHSENCPLPLCPMRRIRYNGEREKEQDKGQESVMTEEHKPESADTLSKQPVSAASQEPAKNVYLPLIQAPAISPLEIRTSGLAKSELWSKDVEADNKESIGKLRNQYHGRKAQLVSTYGALDAIPQTYMQTLQQFDDKLSLCEMVIKVTSSGAMVPSQYWLQMRNAAEMGKVIEDQIVRTRAANRVIQREKKNASKTQTPNAKATEAKAQKARGRGARADLPKAGNSNPNRIPITQRRTTPQDVAHASTPGPTFSMKAPPTGPRAQVLALPTTATTVTKKRKTPERKIPISAPEAKRLKYTPPTGPRATYSPLFNLEGGHTVTVTNGTKKDAMMTYKIPVATMVYPKPKLQEKKKQPGVLVDYDLPMGDDRLDWDTDLVRRLFGEIE
ncbi:hypothetical protein K504DRAFT_492046 [Pleomassaria siparia CBS 279.74]|uniref:C3H1-type domain-containing protein n=1 Tax=Pleomassaria siparia CBS 279.74 TaxID=1314801 RepID=A0A6G1K7F1_9PLEO|nr:hypothetical protein K504DRAFT_492046 [Pleomassaria siparia CBS 279.74]